MPIELLDHGAVGAPIGLHLHDQLEKDFRTKNFFKFLACRRTDFLHHGAAATDENPLLTLTLDVNRGADANQFIGFVEIVEKYGDGERDFFTGQMDGFLANDFSDEEALRLIRVLVWRKVRRMNGQASEPAFNQIDGPLPRERGDREDFLEIVLAAPAIDKGQEAILADAINFIEEQIHRAAEALQPIERIAIGGAEIFSGVDDEGDKVDAVKGLGDFFHHLAVESLRGAMNSGRIDEYDLTVFAIEDALDAVARGLRAGRDNGHFAADNCVDERGFPGVGAAENGDEAGAKIHSRR